MKSAIVIFSMIAVLVLVSGCAQSSTSIKLPGHDDQIYEFSYDVKETLQIPVNNPDVVKQIMDSNSVYTFVFDGSNEADNGRFRVAIINIVTKLKIYYSYEKNITMGSDSFYAFYFLENETGRQWYKSENETVPAPVFLGPVIWFKGPSTDANETSVHVNGNFIYINGATGRGIERAADRFVLAVFGVNNV